MRRTASLDALYMRPSWCIGPSFTILQLDKSTQTDESCLDRAKTPADLSGNNTVDTTVDIKIEKVIRQRLQRTQRGEHSVSSQTLSPIHGTGNFLWEFFRSLNFLIVQNFLAKANPVLIPARPCVPHARPMRSSVEGLNQEIEKLVLHPGQPHTCRPETMLVSLL